MPGNETAWSIWLKVSGQYHWAQVDETRNGKPYRVYRPLRFIQESVWPIINALSPDDPLEVFDKVLLIEREFSHCREASGSNG